MIHILLAEDDQFFSSLISHQLRKSGFEVMCAFDGEDALSQIALQRPDLLLLDILMPKKDGYEVLAELRVLDPAAMIPTIILSNLSDEAAIHRAREAGALDFFVKANITPAEIADKVEGYLNQ